MNILFTCAGRRNYLIKYFKEALGNTGKILAADMQLTAPALCDADIAIEVPSIYDARYIAKIKEIVIDYEISAIISLNDLELPILSEAKADLEALGPKVIISDKRVIEIAFDKIKTFDFFTSIGIKSPKTFTVLDEALTAISNGYISFPVIVKPRWGSASIGIDVANNEKELRLSFELQHVKVSKSILGTVSQQDQKQSILIQEKLNGVEYGIDILNDFEGNYYGSFVRKKLAMRSGETDKAISVIDEKFHETAQQIAEHSKHIGNMDCDFFLVDDEIYYLEMNPRFGGGYPFSHEAGINTPAIYLDWLNGIKDVDKWNNYVSNVMFSKYDSLMQIDVEHTHQVS